VPTSGGYSCSLDGAYNSSLGPYIAFHDRVWSIVLSSTRWVGVCRPLWHGGASMTIFSLLLFSLSYISKCILALQNYWVVLNLLIVLSLIYLFFNFITCYLIFFIKFNPLLFDSFLFCFYFFLIGFYFSI